MLNAIVVDADKAFTKSITDEIRWKDISVNLAGCFDNVHSAMKHLEDNPADVVITDIFSPSQDCENLIEFCKKAYPALRLILTSATKDFAYARMAVKCPNVVDFITKPADFRLLEDSLRKMSRPYDNGEMEPMVANRTFNKKHELFSNLVHGHMTSMDEVRKSFEKLELSTKLMGNPCTLVHFHIDDFMTYIKTNWGENTEHFYDAVSGIVPFETSDKYCSLTNYSYGNLSWFIIHKGRTNTPADLLGLIKNIARELEDNLNLTVKESSHKTWFSLSDMVLSSEFTERGEDKPISTAITEAIAYMRKNYHKDISLTTVAEHVNISPVYFSSYFKKHAGEGFVSKLTNIRIEQVAKLLVTTNMTIRDIKIAVGYGHSGNFYKHFQDRFNMTPNEYKKWYFSK